MSDGLSPDISLREIDTERLENVEENLEAVEFPVRLSGVPTAVWRLEFQQAYLHLAHPIKPPVRIEEDTFYIIYLPRYSSELPDYFAFLARTVRVANEETHQTEALHTSSKQEKQKEDFREALRGVTLPPP